MSEDGEIPFLDADPLHEGMVQEDSSFSEDEDERSLAQIASRLRLAGGRTEEQIEELSAEIYNRVCHQIRSGSASKEQLQRWAELLGETPQGLRDRLS